MLVFRKIWHALFSCNTRFEIRPLLITEDFAKKLSMICLFFETPDLLVFRMLKGRKHLVAKGIDNAIFKNSYSGVLWKKVVL